MDKNLRYVVLSAALLGPLAISADASAQSSSGSVSVCSVIFYPQSSNYGSNGYIQVGYAGGCGGPGVTLYFCSASATNANCDTNYLYREQALLALYDQLVYSKQNAKQVIFWATAPKGAYVQF